MLFRSVLLRFDASVDVTVLERTARDAGVPLRIETLGEPSIAALYVNKLVLVRPDGHVAWRGDALPGDATSLIARVTGHTPA